MNEKKVSVIIPVYRVETYLKRCVSSVINQTYENIEIILVDDGSPDNCPGMCDEFALEDNRIRVIHQNNKGLSAARNSGLKICTGKYILFVDSDDFINVNTIKRWVELLERENADLVVGNIEKYYGGKDIDQIIKRSPESDSCNIVNSEMILKEMFLNNHDLCAAWGKLYKKALLEGVLFREDVLFAEDMYFTHLMYGKAKKICVDDFVAVFYSQEGESLVRSSFSLKKMNMLSAADKWVEYADENYTNITDAALYRNVVITTNLFGDVVYWDDKKSDAILDDLSERINDRWIFIRKSRLFSLKDRFKAYMVKNKLVLMMKIYRKFRLMVTPIFR